MKNIVKHHFFYKPKKMEYVPKTLFAAYLQGGRIWPQKRWSTNIFVMDELSRFDNCNDPYNKKDLKMFFSSIFSPQQLQNVRLVMDQDHLKGDIDTPGITDELLNSQWLKTKVGIHRMLCAFPENKLTEYYNESDYERLTREVFLINENINVNISLEERLFVKSAINFTKNIILKHRDLSRLFILSYYSEQKINVYVQQNKLDYDNFIKKYKCPFLLENEPDKLREWTEMTIFSIIQTSLESKFGKQYPWIIYDNTWNAQYNTKLNQINPHKT